MSDLSPVPTVRAHADLPGHYVSDDLFDTDTLGQAIVQAPSADDALRLFAVKLAFGEFAYRPKEA